MGDLVFAYRNRVCFINENIGCLKQRVSQKTIG